MSRRSELPQSRHHVMIYDEDWDFLIQYYGPDSTSKIGASPAIRTMVHNYVLKLKARQQQAVDAAPSKGPKPQTPDEVVNG